MNSVPIHFNPNPTGRIVFQAMEEILGQQERDIVLDLARFPEYCDPFPTSSPDQKITFKKIGQLQTALDQIYGTLAGCGLSQRVGRACLKYALREFGPGLGVTNLPFRLLPLPTRLKVGSEALTRLFNNSFGQRIELEDDKRHIYLHADCCPLGLEKNANNPSCAMVVGFLQEALYWVSGGKYFQVEVLECIAIGHTKCSMAIDQIPIS